MATVAVNTSAHTRRYKQGAPLDLLWDERRGSRADDSIPTSPPLLVHLRNDFSVMNKVRGHHYIKKNGPVLKGGG